LEIDSSVSVKVTVKNTYDMGEDKMTLVEIEATGVIPAHYHMEVNVMWTPQCDVWLFTPEVVGYRVDGHPLLGRRWIGRTKHAGEICYMRKGQPFGFMPKEASQPMRFEACLLPEHLAGADSYDTPMPDDAEIIFMVLIEPEEIDGVPAGVVHGFDPDPIVLPVELVGREVGIQLVYDPNRPD